MKQLLLVMLMSIMTISFAQDQQKKKKFETVTFSCNMHCVSCEKKIEHNISFEKGVRDVQADVTKHTVTVQYRPNKNDKESIKKAIEKLGYKVTEFKEKEKKEDKRE